MRRATAIAIGLAVAAAALPANSSAREQSRKCYPKDGSRAIAASTRVRVWRGENVDGDYWYYACDLLTGRRTVIAQGTFRDGDGLSNFRFAGRVVAFEHTSCPFTLDHSPCSTSIHTLDVQARRSVFGDLNGTLTDLVALPSGAAAWIEETVDGRPARAVKTVSAEGVTDELDHGAGPEAGSLALARDSRIYWLSGAGPKSAPLEPGPPAAPKRADPDPKGKRACFPRSRSYVYGASTRGRLFAYQRDADSVDVVACNLRTGGRVVVSMLGDDGGFDAEHLRFDGWYMAVVHRFHWRARTYPPVLQMVDLQTNKEVAIDRAGNPESVATDLVLSRLGVAAWVVDGQVRICRTGAEFPGAACKLLDPGPAQAGSLAQASSGRIYWTAADGTPRSAGP